MQDLGMWRARTCHGLSQVPPICKQLDKSLSAWTTLTQHTSLMAPSLVLKPHLAGWKPSCPRLRSCQAG